MSSDEGLVSENWSPDNKEFLWFILSLQPVRSGSRKRAERDSMEGIAAALRIAREAPVALVVVGESAEMSGEAASRSSLDLPGRQPGDRPW